MEKLYSHMVTTRHMIWKMRQENLPQPWTEDPVLTNLKMTNMFRVLDPGSQFVFALDNKDAVTKIARLIFYRITNLPATWYEMKAVMGRYPIADDFINNAEAIADILHQRKSEGFSVFSGAYIIVPNPGVAGSDKMVDAIALVRFFIEEKAEAFLVAETQDERFRLLRSTKGLGRFLAMQILTDWGYLEIEEPDLDFVVAGPGAIKGAALLDKSKKPEDVIREETDNWTDIPYMDLAGRSLTPMDVQNTLCEFSKYVREIKSPRKKTVYRPAHPGAQPVPTLPAWW